jgi:hypothetical protein
MKPFTDAEKFKSSKVHLVYIYRVINIYIYIQFYIYRKVHTFELI